MDATPKPGLDAMSAIEHGPFDLPPRPAPHASRARGTRRRRAVFQPQVVVVTTLTVLLLLGVASYASVRLVFAWNRTWLAPTLLTRSDARVVELSAHHQREARQLSELRLRRSEVAGRLERLDKPKGARPSASSRLSDADDRAAIERAIGDLDRLVADKDRLIRAIASSPYHLAAAEGADVVLGFVPLENMTNLKPGAPLFACRTSVLLCRPVGAVGEALPGEVRAPHPMLGHELRGQLVRFVVRDPAALERPILFARPPLGW